jgi:hypothetical protein
MMCVIGVAAAWGDGTIHRGPTVPLVEWQGEPEAEGIWQSDGWEIAKIGRSVLGIEEGDAVPERGRVVDHSLGWGHDRDRLWRVSVDELRIENPDTGQTTILRASIVLRDGSGDVLCIYTEPAATCVQPSGRNQETMTAALTMYRMKVLPARMERSDRGPVEVIGAVWSGLGVHPGLVGQIVLRPASVIYEDRPAPVDWLTQPLWLGEVRGGVFRARYGIYYSGVFVMLDPVAPFEGSRVIYLQ